ncbi:Carboxylate-amine ligase YbdK [Novipirellula aureliae]|uniref:Carboxylate-amine ligase YbdK n=1 Tax=Novipirellula aureliae TaxID=2527966 RepID=A0A5C6DLD8_9BACT|nr:glutamate-cysteine ligase family protein [Novipirellula aureliae]TWU37588.1 Carboxylate-amine ligase YbdK [Novipirellula aureliae]
MSNDPKRELFDRFGVELEYMLVDQTDLSVRPYADQVLQSLHGTTDTNEFPSDFTSGKTTWSNELASHVIELKNTEPIGSLIRLPSLFESAIQQIRPTLDQRNLRLLPTAMHPWMDPKTETKLWPHECSEIYESYDRIFDCRSHGWANVQSVHLNLPFDGDEQFERLHAAVRLVLPLLPGIAASSPVIDSQLGDWHSMRMKMYVDHCARIPVMMGDVIPEAIYEEATYRRQIFAPIEAAVRPFDPEHLMQCDFLNARGAIARFDRGSMELRVMDVQEYPAADVAICAAVVAVMKAISAQRWSGLELQKAMPTERLKDLLIRISRHGEQAVIEDAEYLEHFGISDQRIKTQDLWWYLVKTLRGNDKELDRLMTPLNIVLEHGSLSTRIRRALGPVFSHEELHNIYDQIADCLAECQPFLAE